MFKIRNVKAYFISNARGTKTLLLKMFEKKNSVIALIAIPLYIITAINAIKLYLKYN